MKHEFVIFKTHYRDWGVRALEFIQAGAVVGDVHVHNIVQSINGKHEHKLHKKYTTINNLGPSFEPSK